MHKLLNRSALVCGALLAMLATAQAQSSGSTTNGGSGLAHGNGTTNGNGGPGGGKSSIGGHGGASGDGAGPGAPNGSPSGGAKGNSDISGANGSMRHHGMRGGHTGGGSMIRHGNNDAPVGDPTANESAGVLVNSDRGGTPSGQGAQDRAGAPQEPASSNRTK